LGEWRVEVFLLFLAFGGSVVKNLLGSNRKGDDGEKGWESIWSNFFLLPRRCRLRGKILFCS
jgi:hypothetical protein